ncbi:hypothetical protein PCANC_20770 [Puccinia coronata f. sp. avenae]|uniref:Uncharacterized protein n=1 Tax=Puccinia coronata f. sp. avenae TaxID=200324 RepID=A0A2N5SA36_9BASI|nr:hypothetical protein PCASD_24966 [Puccinia coronata f. sp. avenae]PLW10107.1 hypothetical protein PCANC_20519 [Puccinia coronata f. sp. avenae]PLW27657.1 hypothetical protein PCASD_19151 [Puccinia coronata f. sp. avenae]PLW28078.1 hypothetical protein PCANC_20770 [Puccinia coronata f. sp. avenae]
MEFTTGQDGQGATTQAPAGYQAYELSDIARLDFGKTPLLGSTFSAPCGQRAERHSYRSGSLQAELLLRVYQA